MAAQMSKKALEQAYILGRKMREVKTRYRNARRLNMKLRLITITNICMTFLKYAIKHLDEYRRLRIFDALYYATDDEDSEEESSEGEVTANGDSEREVTTEGDVDLATGRASESDSDDMDDDSDYLFESYDGTDLFPWEDEEAPHVQAIADYEVDDLFPDTFTTWDISIVVAFCLRESRRSDMVDNESDNTWSFQRL